MSVEAIREAIESVKKLYDERGIFLKKFGFGKKPALIVIDMAYGWTDPAYSIGSARLDEAVAGIRQLLPLCRERMVPVFYTTAPLKSEEMQKVHTRDGALDRHRKWDARAVEIDERLKPEPDDIVIVKENDSAFFGTPLAMMLIERGVDTLIVTGCSTGACVRATATDARYLRFKAIVPRQCVQDRAAESHEWNLFEMDSKWADVVDVEEALEYLRGVGNRKE
jgi:maleamate amidohydrolase